jgi:hypothetical protein
MDHFLKIKILWIYLIFLISISEGSSQSTNTLCSNPTPFCTGQTMQFSAAQNAGSAQSGPNYGCLSSQPNPTWFFMQINQSGSVAISMSAAQDIDFICWGPFTSLTGACSNLTSSNIQSCSYSASNTETCTIANAVSGGIYIMLITNFANIVQTITFNQSNAGATGAGNTNCGFVCLVTPTNSGIQCAGQNGTISVNTSTAVTSFTWSGPGSFTSTAPVNIIPTLTATGTYTVRGTANSTISGTPYSSTCQAVTTISVVPYPVYSITPTSATVCQGGSVTAAVSFTTGTNPSQFSYSWAPSPGSFLWNQSAQSTIIQPPQLPTTLTSATFVYTVGVSRNAPIQCALTKTMEVTVNNPLTPSLTVPEHFCNTFGGQTLIATPGGGTWTSNNAVTPSGYYSPALAAIGPTNVVYSVAVGTCIVSNTASFTVSKYYSPALTASFNLICEYDPSYNLMGIVQNTVGVWTGANVSGGIFNPAGLPSGIYNLTYSTQSSPVASVCPASTVFAVQVFNPPVPVIDYIGPACNTFPQATLTANPPGGVWSLNSGVSASGIQTPSLNSIGTNNVLYTAGIGTCVASSSATFHVSRFNTAAITGTLNNLCVSSQPVNLMSIVQSTTNGSWNGAGVTSTNSGFYFHPSPLPTNTYVLTYNTTSNPNTLLCPDSRTIAVSVLNPATRQTL